MPKKSSGKLEGTTWRHCSSPSKHFFADIITDNKNIQVFQFRRPVTTSDSYKSYATNVLETSNFKDRRFLAELMLIRQTHGYKLVLL